MKDALCLTLFAIGALCFMVFLTVLKPDAIVAAQASSKPEYCKMQASAAQECRLPVFAAGFSR